MEGMEGFETLKESWKAFLVVVLNPWSIFLFVITVLLIASLIFKPPENNQLIVAVYTLMISLFSGILGGVLAKKWEDLNEERVTVARGKSAVRSLQLILVNIGTLEKRVREYLKRHIHTKQSRKQSDEVIKIYLEEVIEKCVTLEEEVLSSIENWTDIVPSAKDAKRQIGLITELNVEINQLKANLAEVENKSAEEITSLELALTTKERELRKARDELLEKGFGGLIVSSSETGIVLNSPSSGFVFPERQVVSLKENE